MPDLPELFIQRMQTLLGGEYAAFAASYDRPLTHSLRVNTEKVDPEAFARSWGARFGLRPVAWCRSGFYYDEASHPGRHPLHDAGVFYIQEASAMIPALLAEALPGQRVLDLCAAPGGKTTGLAAAMKGQGLLVANEIMPDRAAVLSQNVERMGLRNTAVTCEAPDRLAAHFPAWFDRVLVDAPCSGEGMFRKEPQALTHWSPENIRLCAERQALILEAADRMLRPGGTLVYSTCTFAPEECEDTVDAFLLRHPEYTETPVPDALSPWLDRGHFWPHRGEGEGHYVLRLRKEGGEAASAVKAPPLPRSFRPPAEMLAGWRAFAAQTLHSDFAAAAATERLAAFGDNLYLLPEPLPLTGLRVLRPGLQLGTMTRGRFQPAHSLALSLRPEEAQRTLPLDEAEAARYRTGLSLPCDGEAGWRLVLCEGFSLGFGKVSGGQCKNHYPKGLRR